MSNPFLDVMRRLGENGQSDRDRRVSEALDEGCRRLAFLVSACDPRVRQDLVGELSSRVRALLEKGESAAQVSPDVLEWARQQFSKEEVIADLREIRETGGLELRDFIHELEQAAGPDE